MLPAFKQRLLITAAAIAGGLVWVLAAGPLGPADASSGLSLFDAQIGVLPALLVLVLAGLPALALAMGVSATGHPLAGIFTAATGLTCLAGAGGPIRGFVWRHTLPGGYGWLLGETVLWAGLLLAWIALTHRLRPILRPRLGWLATPAHWGDDLSLTLPDGRALLAGLVSMVAAGALATLLLQSQDTGQVIGSLILAFAVGGMVAHLLVAQPNPLAILLSPLALGFVAYGYVLLSPDLGSRDAVLAAWYGRALWGPALALPIYYASAGVCGCTVGLGIAQSIHQARVQAATAGHG